jgi:hypothetical protein
MFYILFCVLVKVPRPETHKTAKCVTGWWIRGALSIEGFRLSFAKLDRRQ